MKMPRNHQYVEIKRPDKDWVLARYYKKSVLMGGASFESRSEHIPAKSVTRWRDASDLDPVGWDMSKGKED